MNKTKYIYRALYVCLSLLVVALIVFISTSAWSHRAVCPTSDEVEKLRIEAANDNAEQGFFAGAAKQKYEIAKSCFQPDEDNKAIANVISASVIVLVVYIALLLLIANLKNKLRLNANKKQYEHLESLALWRFSKVIFWVALPAIVAYLLLYKDSYEHPLFIYGVILGIISFPLFLLFKRLALYIASGKADKQ